MTPVKILELLKEIESGARSADAAFSELKTLPFSDLGHTVLDNHRAVRNGFPEVIFGENKTVQQLVDIVGAIDARGQNVLATRVSPGKAAAVCQAMARVSYHEAASCLVLENEHRTNLGGGTIAIVTAGTSDGPVAEEARLTAELAGNDVQMINDVGVAGVHRLLHRVEDLRSASVVIVVAGMEGALPSVVGGLVAAPVIAVPTSVGYGASFGGVSALLGMLNSCSSGVTVVNIDNGFGAGYAAARMNRIGIKEEER